jgi:hypothetical protein
MSTTASDTSMLDLLLETFIQQLLQQHQDSVVRDQVSVDVQQQQQLMLVDDLQESVRRVLCQLYEEQQQLLHRDIAAVHDEASIDHGSIINNKNKNSKQMKKMRLAKMENDWLWSGMMPALVQQFCDARTQVERGQEHLNALKQVMAALGHSSEQELRRIDQIKLTSSRAVDVLRPPLVKRPKEDEEEEQKSPSPHDNNDHDQRLAALSNNIVTQEHDKGSNDNDGDGADHGEKTRKKRRCCWSWKSLFGNHHRRH